MTLSLELTNHFNCAQNPDERDSTKGPTTIWRMLALVTSLIFRLVSSSMFVGEGRMAVPGRARKKRRKSVKPDARQQEHLRLLLEEHTVLVSDLRGLVREVSALASRLRERSSVGG